MWKQLRKEVIQSDRTVKKPIRKNLTYSRVEFPISLITLSDVGSPLRNRYLFTQNAFMRQRIIPSKASTGEFDFDHGPLENWPKLRRSDEDFGKNSKAENMFHCLNKNNSNFG